MIISPTKRFDHGKKKIDFDKYAAGLFSRTEQYADRVRRHYASAVDELLKLTAKSDLGESGAFSFGDDTKLSEKANAVLRGLYSAVYGEIQNGVQAEWEFANLSCDALIESIFGKGLQESNHFARWFSRNKEAMDSFFARKSAYGGLNLSQRVWRYTGDLKTEMECALTLSLGQGDSAATVSRRVRKYLQEPDKMFRRFRVKTGEKKIYDEEGNVIGTEPIYGRRWKRKVIDPQTGAVTWENFNPRNYHPGRGVYRSSYKNAMRLTRTETNMAYRTAEQDRWQRLDFVIGYEIKLSNNHPEPDICNDLKGKYPKDFVFKGWHPQCRCYVVPILASQDEFISMEKNILDGKEPQSPHGIIRKTPKEFRDWWKKNQERVESATNIPYWVADNQDYIYTGRSKTSREELLRRWEERAKKNQNILTMAGNVSKVAKYYPEIDISKLEEYIASKQVGLADKEARDIAQQVLAAKKDEKLLSQLIPDVHGWKTQFSSAELHQVYDAVESKLASLSGKTLEEQLKALTKEATYVSDPNYLKPHKLYPTWQVAQSAYAKQIARVQDEIEWKAIGDVLAEAKTFKTKSQPYLDLVGQLEAAIASKDKVNAKFIVSDMQAKREALKKAADARARKKSTISATNLAKTKLSDDGVVKVGEVMVKSRDASWDSDIFDELEEAVMVKDAPAIRAAIKKLGIDIDDSYCQFRRDAARWHLTDTEANDYFFGNATEAWLKASASEREAMWSYTAGSSYITEPLRAIDGYHHYYTDRLDKARRHVDGMTSYIDRSTFDDDVWVKRDEIAPFMRYRFNLPKDLDSYASDPSKLVGMVGRDDSFMSCGSCKGTSFGSKPVCLNIYCPKGTKATYAEPFSEYGSYHDNGTCCPGKNWDGKSKPTSLNENEIILQRGTQFRITKAEYTHGKWYIDLEVIGQDPREIKEWLTDSGGFYCKF